MKEWKKKYLTFAFVFLEVTLFLLFLSVMTNEVFAGFGEDNVTVRTNLTVGNVYPEVLNVSLQGDAVSMTLVANQSKLVFCEALLRDYNNDSDFNTVTGRLFGNVTGDGLDNAKIRIYENDGTLLKETPLASGNTSILGGFNIDWIVKKMDWWDDSIEVLARFDGEDNLKGSYSKKLSFHVIK